MVTYSSILVLCLVIPVTVPLVCILFLRLEVSLGVLSLLEMKKSLMYLGRFFVIGVCKSVVVPCSTNVGTLDGGIAPCQGRLGSGIAHG